MAFGRSDKADDDPLVGKTLGDYVLEERIGRGGMGSVYRALRKAHKHRVALKILSPFMASDEGVVVRFTREAQAASRIRHPNVVRVFGYAFQDGIRFTAMEYVEGENLAEILKREGRLSIGHAAFIACEVAQGLRALHHEGIIHRDVKPSNILIGRDGSVKIADFGIARDLLELQRLTAPGDLLGTLGFAAPEQLHQSEVDSRADLYSLGVTLHYMLSGIRPPTTPTTPFAPLSDAVPIVIRDLVTRLLATDRSARPENAASVASTLAPYSERPGLRSLRKRSIQIGLKVIGGALAFWAGALATTSHGPTFRADPWSLVFPVRGAVAPSALLFGLGVLITFFAFIRGRDRMGVGIQSVLGSCFLAASLVVAYMAGAAIGTLSLGDATRALVSLTPEVLFAEALALAAIGLSIGMKKPARVVTQTIGGALILVALGAAATASSAGSVTQAVDDLRTALSRGGWAWVSFLLAGLGILLAYRHRGQLSQLFLAPLAVFISLGLVYWASLGEGSPPLQTALAAPGGELALAVLLALGARATLDLRPRAGRSSDAARELDTPGSSPTPPPVV